MGVSTPSLYIESTHYDFERWDAYQYMFFYIVCFFLFPTYKCKNISI